MFTIIDRYIFKSFLAYFLAGLLVVGALFLAADFMTSFVRFEPELSSLIRYYAYYMPYIIYQMIPVAILIATLFTLSQLNRSNEMVALFSMGVSLARICAPILVLVGLISVGSFWVGDRILPKLMQQRNYIYYVELRDRPHLYAAVRKNRIWYRSQNIIFNIQTLNVEQSRAQGLTMYYLDDAWNIAQLIKAKEVALEDSTWDLRDGTVTLFMEESSFPVTQTFEQKTLTMSEDIADIRSAPPTSEVLSVGELRRFYKRNKELGLDTLRYEVDYYAKFSFAAIGIVFCLIGIPFTTKRERSGGMLVNIGFCAGLALFYWIMFGTSLSLGYHGVLRPTLAAWGPNILAGAIAIFALLRLKK